jgi:CheY-like chemotaxis protein
VKVTISGGANSSSPSLPRIDPKDAAPADVDHVLARLDTPSPDATIRPGSIARAAAASAPAAGAVLDMLLTEIAAIKKMQEEILGLLRAPASRSESLAGPEMAPARPPGLAASRGGTVLIIDDDTATREEAAGALRSVGRVKTADDGHSALATIASEKPAAIVLELGLGGAMPGQELVNVIKATMDWVDIPIVIHTRLELGDEEEAKHEHGADAVVVKRAGSAALVARAISQLLAR